MDLVTRPLPAPLAVTGKRPLFPATVPNLRTIHARFQHLYTVTGTPYYLPTYEAVQRRLGLQTEGRHEGRFVLGGNPPWTCVGPKIRQNQRRCKYVCFKHNFCLYCAERKAWRAAQRAVRAHHANPFVVKFSISLPAVRTQPALVRDAKVKVGRLLRDHGYSEVSLNIHVFGENPFEGPKGHLDGIASGTDPNLAILDNQPLHDRLEAVLAPYHVKPEGGTWNIHVSNRMLASSRDPKAFLRDLTLAGYYSGRSTLNPRRLFAGMYGTPPTLRVRMTNVHRAQNAKDVRDMLDHAGQPLRHYNQAELIEVQVAAERWEDIIGRPVYAREPPLDAALWAAFTESSGWWRHVYRLPSEPSYPE